MHLEQYSGTWFQLVLDDKETIYQTQKIINDIKKQSKTITPNGVHFAHNIRAWAIHESIKSIADKILEEHCQTKFNF